MSYFYRGHGTRFGVRLQNGMTLERAVNNPNSNLAKVVRYLMVVGRATKEDICVNVLGFKHDGRLLRGWNSYLFRAMRGGNFVNLTWEGKKYYYSLGPNACVVKLT